MTDPRQGLRRRFNGVDEILEAHGGQTRIQGLNYNALRTLRSPLYPKFAEQLRDEGKAATQARLDYDEFAMMLRRFSSENDVPYDMARDILTREMDTQTDAPDKMDDDDDGATAMDVDDSDDDDDDFDGGPGSLGGSNDDQNALCSIGFSAQR